MQFAFRRREQQAAKRILLVLYKNRHGRIENNRMVSLSIHMCPNTDRNCIFKYPPPPKILHRTVWSFHTYTQRVMQGLIMGGSVFPISLLKPCMLNYTADFPDKWKHIPPSPKQLKMSPDCRSYLGISQHLMISLCKSNLFSRSGLFITWWQLQGMRKKWHPLSERYLFWEVREGEGFWAMNHGIPILYWTFIDLLG